MNYIRVFYRKTENREDVYKLLGDAACKVYSISMPKILKDKNGKPFFEGREDINFSLSHSGDYVMCALSDEPVGADIQEIKQLSPQMIKRVFTEGELNNADPINLWCLKESFIKLQGLLDRQYSKIEFIRDGDNYTGPENCKGKVIDCIDGYIMAVCSYKNKNVIVSTL